MPSGLQVGLGTRPSANEIVFSQGSFSETDNPLDVVIQGKGFFQVKQPSGEIAYTRDGSFQLDKNGNIVTASGDPIEPTITIPPQAQNHHHRRRRDGQLHAGRTDGGAARRADPDRRLPESRRPQ